MPLVIVKSPTTKLLVASLNSIDIAMGFELVGLLTNEESVTVGAIVSYVTIKELDAELLSKA